MALLDNSSDVLLQAVLTDLGRQKMANGTFKIAKYCFGDDEINYALFNGSHASGSAYYDLEILQTPVFEPVTDNASALKSKLITIANTNLLYLPVLKLNTVDPNTTPTSGSSTFGSGSHVVVVDQATLDMTGSVILSDPGMIDGFNGSLPNGRGIRIDQGLDTTELSAQFAIDSDLKETQYVIEMDNRLLQMYDVKSGNKTPTTPTYVDDDQIASYYVSQNIGNFVENSALGPLTGASSVGANTSYAESISGPRGTKLKFGLLSSITTRTSSYLFTLIGNSMTVSATNYYYIDTVVRVSGVNTGYRIDVPVRLLKKA